ncbi:uncharacterized protein LOC143460337 [Clavelina lepadiformis]|uniref:uncharacterized protein LOC143460337 n=1 Tax=Clavelina lepadiformis TaxID=159417 RepID=UPI004041FF60
MADDRCVINVNVQSDIFMFHPNKLSFDDAKNYCQQHGSKLAIMEDRKFFNHASTLTPYKRCVEKYYTIGLVKRPDSSSYVWLDGRPYNDEFGGINEVTYTDCRRVAMEATGVNHPVLYAFACGEPLPFVCFTSATETTSTTSKKNRTTTSTNPLTTTVGTKSSTTRNPAQQSDRKTKVSRISSTSFKPTSWHTTRKITDLTVPIIATQSVSTLYKSVGRSSQNITTAFPLQTPRVESSNINTQAHSINYPLIIGLAVSVLMLLLLILAVLYKWSRSSSKTTRSVSEYAFAMEALNTQPVTTATSRSNRTTTTGYELMRGFANSNVYETPPTFELSQQPSCSATQESEDTLDHHEYHGIEKITGCNAGVYEAALDVNADPSVSYSLMNTNVLDQTVYSEIVDNNQEEKERANDEKTEYVNWS